MLSTIVTPLLSIPKNDHSSHFMRKMMMIFEFSFFDSSGYHSQFGSMSGRSAEGLNLSSASLEVNSIC